MWDQADTQLWDLGTLGDRDREDRSSSVKVITTPLQTGDSRLRQTEWDQAGQEAGDSVTGGRRGQGPGMAGQHGSVVEILALVSSS